MIAFTQDMCLHSVLEAKDSVLTMGTSPKLIYEVALQQRAEVLQTCCNMFELTLTLTYKVFRCVLF